MQNVVDNAAWCETHAPIVAEFRYGEKKTGYWNDLVRHKGQKWMMYSFAIPNQCFTTFGIRALFRCNVFLRLTEFLRRIGFPHGFHSTSPLVLTHNAEELTDPDSSCLVVT